MRLFIIIQNLDVKRPRRQLKFAAGTIGVVNKECK